MSIPASIVALHLATASINCGGDLPDAHEPLAVTSTSANESQGQATSAATPSQMAPVTPAARAGFDPNDIVVTARPRSANGDPLEKVNVKSFEVAQAVDKAFVGPVALAYQHAVPGPIRSGVRNFLYNLREPVVFLNFLLQLKPGKGAETFGRFAINTTIGGAGLVDVAKRRPFGLPRRPNGFANSIGYYGIKPGPFMFLPLIGPTTLRDLAGDGLDRLILPLAFGKPFNQATFTVPTNVIGALDRRAEFDEQLRTIRDGSADPYQASRALYLRRRQAEIDDLHGRQPSESKPTTGVSNPAIYPLAQPDPRASLPGS